MLHHLELLDLYIKSLCLISSIRYKKHTLSLLHSIFMLWKVKSASESFKGACNSLQLTSILSITCGSPTGLI